MHHVGAARDFWGNTKLVPNHSRRSHFELGTNRWGTIEVVVRFCVTSQHLCPIPVGYVYVRAREMVGRAANLIGVQQAHLTLSPIKCTKEQRYENPGFVLIIKCKIPFTLHMLALSRLPLI